LPQEKKFFLAHWRDNLFSTARTDSEQ
jgi:hypothetical protein